MQAFTDRPLAYSIREAARVSSLSRGTLYLHISNGTLRSVKILGRRIIPADALAALLEGRA